MGNVPGFLAVNSTYILIFVTCTLAITAVAQFELSRRSSQRQLRAYVVPDRGEIFAGEEGEPRARIALRNCGQTPARGVLSWAKIHLVKPEQDESLGLLPSGVRSGTTLAANGYLNKALWFRTLSAEEADHVRSGSMAICVSGIVEYRDVFQHRHVTQFRFAYSGPFPPPPNASLELVNRANRET